jgi:hypothetical protein
VLSSIDKESGNIIVDMNPRGANFDHIVKKEKKKWNKKKQCK